MRSLALTTPRAHLVLAHVITHRTEAGMRACRYDSCWLSLRVSNEHDVQAELSKWMVDG
jgi:hypothetical protein